jgi:hypothetical protein
MYHIERNRENELAITRNGKRLFTITVRQLVEMLDFHRVFQRLVIHMRGADTSQHKRNPFIDVHLWPTDKWKLTVRHYASGGLTITVGGRSEETNTIPHNEIALVLAEVLKGVIR